MFRLGVLVLMSAVATSLLAQSQPPLGERLLVAAVGPLITVLVGGLVVWAVTSKVQHNREEADRKLQQEREDAIQKREQDREDAIRAREEQRADAEMAREWRARDDTLRHELVTSMTEAAGTLYLTGQHYWRLKDDAEKNRNDATLKALDDFRATLDAIYQQSSKNGEVVEKRLEGYFVSSEPRDSWHRAMDALTVRYFQLIGRDTDRLYEANAGPQHTGLSMKQLKQTRNNSKLLLNCYREALAAAVQGVFETPMRARSEAPGDNHGV